MPAHNTFDTRKIVAVPDGVTSFKVYDDGGKDCNYTKYCNANMDLRVSGGYRIKLTGSVTTSTFVHDYLRVSEGYEFPYITLGSVEGYGYPEGEGVDLMSDGSNMILLFTTSYSETYSGLDLRVDVDNTVYPYSITVNTPHPIAGCFVYPNVSTAHVNDVITLGIDPDDDYILQELTVQDVDGNDIPLSQGMLWYNGNNSTATFTMPGRNVILTYDFVRKGDQYVKMPKKNTLDAPLQVTFPEGITSCKVYDDGGVEANYSDYCNAYTLFTAPEGKVWQLTGKVKSEYGSDYMVPYDGDTTTHLIDFYHYGKHTGDGEDIGGLVTFSNQMLIRFYSDYLINYEGLDLTATVIDPLTRTVEGYAGAPAGQGRWAFIAAPMKYYTLPENVVNLIPETNGIPDPTSSHFDLYRFNQSAELEWENYKAHADEFSLDAGQGYLYANMYTQTLQFGGAVNIDDSKKIALDYDANAELKGWNLVGNPLLTAAFVNRPYYRMDEFGSNIEPVEHYRLLRVPAYTGIMVMAEDEFDTITFSKTIQPQFTNQGCLLVTVAEQAGASDGTVGLKDIQDRAIVSFNEGTRLAKYVFNKDNAKLHIQQDGSEYAIAYSEKHGEVPLGFKVAQNGAYVLTVIPENVNVEYLHLIDRITGADIDLLSVNKYSFNATTNDDELRFRLVFSAYGLPEVTEDADQDFAYLSNGSLIINGEGTLQIIDALGRILKSEKLSTLSSQLSTLNFKPGVYVLRLIDGENTKTQKIVIK